MLRILTVLAATARTQGQRDHDFMACSPGELVDLSSACDGTASDPDGRCGCGGGYTGLSSRKATTTAEVVVREMTVADYVAAHHASLVGAGLPDDDATRKDAAEAARAMLLLAASFPVGAVVERRGDKFVERPTPSPTLRGCMQDGYTPDDVNSAFAQIYNDCGITLVCVWDYHDTYGPGGHSQFYVTTETGVLHELAGELWRWLNESRHSPTSPLNPGQPTTWTGGFTGYLLEDLAWHDGQYNYAVRRDGSLNPALSPR